MIVRAAGRTLELGARPWLMGIVNATPDSFSDAGRHRDKVTLGLDLLEQGADLLDVGGESAITGRPPVEPAEEIARVVPVVEALAGHGALVSVDTYKPAVAEAAIAAGAVMVNDVSGLRDPELAGVCARTGAALVVMHTRAAPKQRLQDPGHYDDVVADEDQLVLDPGPDFAKTPAQTIALLRRLDEVRALGRPLLLAASRKDFIGALTRRPPRERLAGTLAAIAWGVEHGAAILRVHDVREVADFLAVRAALRGDLDVAPDLALTEEIRLER